MRMQNTVRISKRIKSEIEEFMTGTYPYECCGIIIGDKTDGVARKVISIENSAHDGVRNEFFEIDPLEMYRIERLAEEEGAEIIGIYHSHPDKAPILSKADIENMIPEILYLVGAVTEREVEELRGYIRCASEGIVHEVIIQEG